MTDTVYYPYLGSGKIYARAQGSAAGLMELGNASKLELAVKEDKQKLKDFSKPGGGTYSSVSRISEATLQMTLNDLNKTNVARAVFLATYDDGPDARAAALAAGLAAGRAAYRDALPGASTRDGLARLDAAIIAVIAVTRDADIYLAGAP